MIAIILSQLLDPFRLVVLIFFSYLANSGLHRGKRLFSWILAITAVVGTTLLMPVAAEKIAFSAGKTNKAIERGFNPFSEPFASKIPYGEYSPFESVYNRENFINTVAIIKQRYSDCKTILGYSRPGFREYAPNYSTAMARCRMISYKSGALVGTSVLGLTLFVLNFRLMIGSIVGFPSRVYWFFISIAAFFRKRNQQISKDIDTKMND